MDILKRKNTSKWAAPSFIIPKKYGTIFFISDFRENDKRNLFTFLKYRVHL